MKRDARVYMDDILESIERIQEYTKGMREEEFLSNVPKQDAVIRRFEIIGEAVKNIPEEIRKKYPDIEWKKAAGTRDIFIHEYFGIGFSRVWNTIVTDLPKLKNEVAKMLQEYQQGT